MTEELLTNYQHVITDFKLVTGGKGIFDVEVDGRLIYSKHETNRFPNPDEVLERLEPLLPAGTSRFGS